MDLLLLTERLVHCVQDPVRGGAQNAVLHQYGRAAPLGIWGGGRYAVQLYHVTVSGGHLMHLRRVSHPLDDLSLRGEGTMENSRPIGLKGIYELPYYITW